MRKKVHETILEGLSLEKVRDKIRDEIKANTLSQVEESVELPTDNESLEKKVERMDEDERKTLSLFTSGTKSSQLSSRVFTEEQTQVIRTRYFLISYSQTLLLEAKKSSVVSRIILMQTRPWLDSLHYNFAAK